MPTKGDYICKTCDGKSLKATQAFEHNRKGHDVWQVNAETGELISGGASQRSMSMMSSIPVRKSS